MVTLQMPVVHLVLLDEKSHEYNQFLRILVQAGETARKGHGATIRYFVQHSQAWNPGSSAVAYLVAATAASIRDWVLSFHFLPLHQTDLICALDW